MKTYYVYRMHAVTISEFIEAKDEIDALEIFKRNLMNGECKEPSVNEHFSKAVGEPPLLLSASVFAAVKDALRYVTPSEKIQLRVPATPEEVLMKIPEYEL